MKAIYFFLIFLSVFITRLSAQVPANNSCFTPVVISPSTSCNLTAGTTTNATQSYASGCGAGVADDDVWYSFVATSTTANITVYASSGFDAVIELHGSCTAANLACKDVNPAGGTETMTYTSLTIGSTYLVRVYHYQAGAGTGFFNICITTGAPPPAAITNNVCGDAIALTVSPSCNNISGTTFGANQSFASGCGAGNADDDVWYSFVATASTNTITVAPSFGFDAVIELHDYCTATNMTCADVNANGGTETLTASSLTPGATYLVRVYHYDAGAGSGAFNICVAGPSAPSPPANDEPCGAIALPVVTSNCNYATYSTAFATETSTSLAPAPSSCTGGAVTDGGYSADAIEDVWFSVVVPSTGSVHVQAYPDISGDFITDGAMALYTGSSCSALTQVACSDDNNYPGSTYDNLPVLRVSSLTPGSTVYIRYWATEDTDPGSFGICVTTATNDACSTALYVCDLNGYSATTSSAYTIDRPDNMRGNAETSGTYAYTPGTNQGGVFGSDPPQAGNTGAPNYDVQIDNNSWVRFTAGAATATFTVTISNCWINKGVQMQIFSADSCTNFASVSDFKEGATNYTLSAQGLTPYQDYYLMVDGWGGDICNYTIQALSGVLLPEITAASPDICLNESIILHGPAGASSYSWSTGQTTQDITVSPTTTTDYTLTAGGVCGQTQILTKNITVNPLPVMTSSAAPAAICSGTAVGLSLTSSIPSTYSWMAADNADVTGESTSAQSGNTITNTLTVTSLTNEDVVYTVTPTSNAANGTCTGTAQTVTVTVKPRPTLTDPADQSVCGGAQVNATTFTTSPAGGTVNWTSSGSTSAGIAASGSGDLAAYTAPVVGSQQTVTVTATPTLNSCVGLTNQSFTIVVKPTPVITAVTNTTVCGNTLVNGINFSASPTTPVSWTSSSTATGLSTVSGTGSVPSFTAATVSSVTTSTVNLNATLNGCAAAQVPYTITVNPLPSLTVTPTETQSACGLATGALNGASASGSGSLNYVWTNSSNDTVGTVADITNMPAGSYNLTVTDASCKAAFGPFSITNPGAPAAPTITAANTTLCVGDTLSLLATSAETNPTFAWSGPNASSAADTLAITTVGLSDAGTYTVTVTVSNCASTNTIAVVVNPNPTALATNANNVYCSGTAVDLFGLGGAGYAWTGPGSYSSADQNPQLTSSTTAMSGTYTLTVTNAQGCSATDTTEILVNQTPSLPAVTSSPTNICVGDTISLTALSAGTGTITYDWTGPGSFTSTQQDPVILNAGTAQSGTYSVVATAWSCSSAVATITITVNTNPVAAAGISGTPVCSGTDVTLNANGGATYAWTGPGSYSSGDQNPQLSAATVSMSGTYTVEVTDNNGCSAQDSIVLTVNQTPGTPVITASSDTLCEGEDLQLDASSTSAVTYGWTGPNGFTSSVSNPQITSIGVSMAGTYTVSATANACISPTETITIVVNTTPVANATATASNVCSGNSIDLNATGGTTFSWSGPNTYTSTQANNTLSNIDIAASGTYTFTAINPGNCTDTATVTITVVQTPAAPIVSGDSTCTGTPLELTASGNGTFSWYSDAALTNLVSNNDTLYPALPPNSAALYYVTLSNNGCTSMASAVNASNYDIHASFVASVTSGYAPLPVTFTNTSTGVDGSDVYNWSMSNVSFANTINAQYEFTQAGTFSVVLAVMDAASGCLDTAAVSIFVEDEIRVIIPNVFTPNGDGINDSFELDIKGAKEAEGTIYNRWGQVLHQWDAVNSTWDGKLSNGEPVSDGIYFYIIKIVGYNGKKMDVPGNVTIVR